MSRSTGDRFEDLLNQYQKGFNLLQQAHHIERNAISEEAEDDGIGRGQGKLLRLLLAKDGLFIKEIVLELDMRPSSASELIDKLTQKNLVQRVTDKDDKRVKKVILTAEGKACAERIKSSHAGIYQEIFAGLTLDEQQELSGLLKKLNTSLNAKVEADKGKLIESRGNGQRSHNARGCKSRKSPQIHSIPGRKKHQYQCQCAG